MMWKCEKGKKQYKVCKEANADYCSDCPHGIKENIEEDIKILEEMIENANIENMDMNNCFGGEHIEAIEHILTDYKKVTKEKF